MRDSLIKELQLRLKAPIIALGKVAKGQYLPRVFAKAALDELKIIQRLIKEDKTKR
jgi:hypothetical protein